MPALKKSDKKWTKRISVYCWLYCACHKTVSVWDKMKNYISHSQLVPKLPLEDALSYLVQNLLPDGSLVPNLGTSTPTYCQLCTLYDEEYECIFQV